MKRPATATIAVFVAVVLVAAVIVAVVGLGTDGATAITVGDAKVSREQLNDELAQLADIETTDSRSTAGAVRGEVGARVATQVIYELLAQRYIDRTGESVTAADRAQAQESVAGDPAFEDLPQDFQDLYLDRQAVYYALTRLVGEDDAATVELAVIRRESRRAGVTVDPAYGRWAPAGPQVVPYPTPFTPQGSAQAP